MSGSDLSGAVIEDRYEIHERIAAGAMGVVYRGNRLKLDRAVAIKVMHASLPAAMDGRKRFEREAKLMAKLEHPHCVSIIDYGLHGSKPYVVMELVRGRSLHDLIVEQGRVEPARAVDVLRQVLSGLAHAHEQGIIHRDIKPANIMVTPKAPLGLHARILDFGLARMLEASASMSNGVAVGTPSYMAPEQCRGEQLDARVDIYACGVVLFEMLTGKKPFIEKDPISIIKKALEEPVPKMADVTPGDYGALQDVVERALAKSPGDRYPTAVAMAEALDAALSGRVAPEATTEVPLAAIATKRADPEATRPLPSADVPITVGSSVRVKPEPPGSSIRRELPRSRMRMVVLGGVVVVAAAAIALVVFRDRLFASEAPREKIVVVEDKAPPPAPAPAPRDPADEIVASAVELADAGKTQAAIDSLVKARRVYPDSARLAHTLGKLYFAKMWWNDGLANLRDAVKLDPTLRADPELIAIAARAFTTTPSYDHRLASFLLELDPEKTKAALEDIARARPNPDIRSRVQALVKRLRADDL
ncbi:MAG TPA: serine/threonine-protein kinase [Kofleriaceae bacterium]|nr:serine/threonine-protein kinase [Kofleriaceae bacterium]